jgi:hypothetical protein
MSEKDSNVIVGLYLDVPAAEPAEHARRRSAHHGERARIYDEEVTKIEKLQRDADKETRTLHKGSVSNSPVEGLDRSAKNHKAKERFFAFAAEHFVKDKVYRLAVSDLSAFEIAPSNY